jgi:predicted amidohydrolase
MDISIVQTQLYWESIEKNLSNIDSKINAIKNTDLILLPEMFNTSFSPRSIHLAEGMDGRTVSWMKAIAKKKKMCYCWQFNYKRRKKIL